MANWQDPRTTGVNTATIGVPRAARDVGLRSYMLSVYNYMASGVLLTGIVALLFAPYAADILLSQSGRGMSPLGWIVILSPLAIVFAMSFGITRMRTSRCSFCSGRSRASWAFHVDLVPGVHRRFDRADLLRDRGGLSRPQPLWLHDQARSVGFGTFLIMGVVGMLVAMLVNMFLQSSAMALAISAIGVLLFAGLTAYDTQRIKSLYFQVQGSEMAGKAVIMGALSLYLDFINMFQFLLMFMGNRR